MLPVKGGEIQATFDWITLAVGVNNRLKSQSQGIIHEKNRKRQADQSINPDF